MPSSNLEPQDYGQPGHKNSHTEVETVEAGQPSDIPQVEDDVQSDPALSVFPAADWADEGGAVANPS